MHKGICIGGPADKTVLEGNSMILDVPNHGIGIYRYLWFSFPGGDFGVWASAGMDYPQVMQILTETYTSASADALRKDRDELAARVTELCQKITKDGGRLGIIASRYGWRGSQNNIEFIGKRMSEMQEEIDVLRKYAAPPAPRVENTITVDVTGMADLEKRVADLERLAYGASRSNLNTRPLRDRG